MTASTIVAIATAPGRGSVGIIRISGSKTAVIAKTLLGFEPTPRHAHYCDFKDTDGEVLDQGIALFFANPHSFTGEDILELQGHGGPIILDLILQTILQLGAVLAKPGEFSERAFLNDKFDLTQAEAIADLIQASSVQAAKQALNSLQGAFSQKIDTLVEQLIQLRIYVEAAIDFPEEEIDFLSDGRVAHDLNQILHQLEQVLNSARQGVIMQEGMKVVIAGRPNAGKSSLLNALSQKDLAIVTDIPGTTRDLIKEHIHIEGMPLHLIDTAGLRLTEDPVEKIGIARAWQEIYQADRILLLIDVSETNPNSVKTDWPEFFSDPLIDKLTWVANKSDKLDAPPKPFDTDQPFIPISAKTGAGLYDLKQHLISVMGLQTTAEGQFSARRRHLEALNRAKQFLLAGHIQLSEFAAGELLAEDLRGAQHALSEITGAFTSDDLLGRIFSGFCIGK